MKDLEQIVFNLACFKFRFLQRLSLGRWKLVFFWLPKWRFRFSIYKNRFYLFALGPLFGYITRLLLRP